MTDDQTPQAPEWATCPTCGGTYLAGFACVSCWEGTGVPRQRPALSDARQHGYRSLLLLGRVLQIVFLAWTLLLAVSLTFNWALYRLVSRIADSPGSVSVEEITSNNDRQQLIWFIIIGSTIATGVVFIIWMRRMYLNIQSFGMRTIHGVGWVTGGWLVPILNLWRPKQIVDEIWRSITPQGESREVSRVLHFWWGFWVSAGVVGDIVSISMGDEVSGSGEALLYVALTTASLAAAVLAFWVVTLLTSRHERFVRGIFEPLDC